MLFNIIQNLVKPVWIENGGLENQTYQAAGIYFEQAETIDVIFLGTSHVYCGVSPYEIYKDFGISSYVYSSSEQPFEVTYYRLLDAYKDQKATVVALDVSSLFRKLPYLSEGFNRTTFDYMPLSINKLFALKDALNYDEKITDYVVPFLYYHNRWSELEKMDFLCLRQNWKDLNKGYSMISRVQQYDDRVANNAQILQFNYKSDEITEKTKLYFEKILDFCNENGLQLFLYKVPSLYYWNENYSQIAHTFFDSYNLDFYDFQYDPEYMIDIDWGNDSCDLGNHLNIRGAEKVSNSLGKLLIEKYSLPDHRNYPEYEDWEAGLNDYLKRKEIALLQSELDAEKYFERLQSINATIFFAVRDDMSFNFDSTISSMFQKFGFSTDMVEKYHHSFLGIYSDEISLYEDMSNQYIKASGNLDSFEYSLASGGFFCGDTSSIKINGTEYSMNYRGLNMAVFDSDTGELLDVSCIDFYDSRKMYHNYSLINKLINP